MSQLAKEYKDHKVPKRIVYLASRFGPVDPQPKMILQAMRQANVKCKLQNNFTLIAIGRILKYLGVMRNIFTCSDVAYITHTSHASDSSFFWRGLFYEIIPYAYDCWPNQYNQWLKLFSRNRTRIAFFSSKSACSFFQSNCRNLCAYWMPEAIDVDLYDSTQKLSDRSIDILQYGRSYAHFNNIVKPGMAATQRNCVFSDGKVIFSTFNQLSSVLANAKLVVCYPKSLTDPVGSGGLETVTLRYFEVMASRALPIGYCPQELKELFGYDPVIPLDLNRAVEQIENILSNIDAYQALVDRNLDRVKEVGTWNVRVPQMLSILGHHGYRIPAISEE